MKCFVAVSFIILVFLQSFAVQNVHCAPILSTRTAKNNTSPTDSVSLSPEIVVSNGVPVAIVFPDPTQAPAPIPTGETLIVETPEGDFELVTRKNHPKTNHPYQESYGDKQNSISSVDLESIVRKLIEKIHLDSLQKEQHLDTSEQNVGSERRQLATLIPEPTTSGPSDLLLFPSPQQLGPNVARIPLKNLGSFPKELLLELQIHIDSPDNIRVALPTDIPVPTEIPPPFSQVGSNQPFFFLGPPTVFEPNQTQSSRVSKMNDVSRQIGNWVLDQVAQHLSKYAEDSFDDFERYIIGKNSYKVANERLSSDATQAPLPVSSSQPKQGTTVPLSLANLPPPPAVVLPNGTLS
ncbi:hypothetical protein GpartN1_g5972.t1 [Galdieria partita]|uniref:Uncharacterized protein n=1 Tax=Galdieria partita TaxID=83374 RepID=A0A9C7Q0U3_9RHOD|nr:hypothetical protein GpartN1_g5972.t1 [Galdieria partita]